MLICFKEILNSWIKSLKIFIPSHGKLFFLVSVKTIVESYKSLVGKFWWLFLVCIGIDILNNTMVMHYGLRRLDIGAFLLWCLLGFVVFLTIRPSIALKNFNYYFAYYYNFFIFTIVTSCCLLLWDFAILAARESQSVMVILNMFSQVSLLFFSNLVYLSPLWMMFAFCSLDSEKNGKAQLKALWRAIKMVFYNYPFFIIIALVTWLGCLSMRAFIVVSVQYLAKLFLNGNEKILLALQDGGALLILPVFICIVSNFYSKQVHEEFKRYF